MLVRDPRSHSDTFFIDEDVLAQQGVTDFDRYRAVPAAARWRPTCSSAPLENGPWVAPHRSPPSGCSAQGSPYRGPGALRRETLSVRCCAASPDGREEVDAFLAKRPPAFPSAGR
ncbi:MAG: hypothetical protein M3Q47_20505 [Actinomycetota bacterium]|nr:hypothetical protein [Actinomycetota bacterium]